MLVGQATGAGLVLRLDLFQRLGLNQFDEGIYAFAANWAFGQHGLAGLDPGLIPYAPPGYSILVGLMSVLIGPSDQACLLVSALAGTLTIPAVALIARGTFGERAAVASAWCVGCSGPHIAFSRSGLTDASFLLVWALGLIAALRFFVRRSWGAASMMGLLVGLAQEFKYNGWLLGGLVIVTAATCGVWPSPGQPRLFGRLIVRGLLGVVVAAVVVLPWYSFVESHGGYAGLLAHQRSYLGGWAGWLPHLKNQADQAAAMAGPAWLQLLGTIAIGIAPRWVDPNRPPWFDRAAFASCLTAGAVYLALLAAPATTFLLWASLSRDTADLGRRLVLVGGLVLFILTPFYHPYARLWLPFELFHWLTLGWVVDRIVEAGPSLSVQGRTLGARSKATLFSLAVLVLIAWGPGFPLARSGSIGRRGLFAGSDSLRVLAEDVVRLVPPDAAEVRTLIRPPLSYYLGGRIPGRPQASREGLLRDPQPGSWALVDSTILGAGQGEGEPSLLGRGRGPLGEAWEQVARFDAANSLITTLDLDPSAGPTPGGCSVARIWLLRPRSEGFPR